MYWEDDDRATNIVNYSSTSNMKCNSDYKPVYKIMKELYDEEKEAKVINVRNKKETFLPVKEVVTPVVEEEVNESSSQESPSNDELEVESDIVNSVLENKINNKFCYY